LETHPTASPATVASYLLAAATKDQITGAGTGSPNLLLFTEGSATPTACRGKNCK
jgi:aqualysin 1